MLIKVTKTKQSERFPEKVSEAVEYIKVISQALGFDDTWRLVLTFKHCGDSLAFCQTEWEYRKSVISINLYKTDEDPHGLRNTVIHEMLHIPLWQVHDLITSVAELTDETSLEEQMRKSEEATVTFLEHAPMWNLILPEKNQ
jgi:hypothetical protein